jgi:hypothetical protein
MPLSEQSYQQVAQGTGLEPAKIKAVDEVESRGEGFLPSGEPKILFEAHWFSRFTDGKYDESHPEISSPEWDPSLYEGGAAEHDRLQEATDLNRKAALKSASWGRFQIMGFNWKTCGYESLQAFVNGMYESEEEHLRAFLAFLRNEDLLDPLRSEDWRTFARGYNGPQYDNHDYHVRLRNAYQEQVA